MVRYDEAHPGRRYSQFSGSNRVLFLAKKYSVSGTTMVVGHIVDLYK